MTLDAVDRRILEILQENGRITNAKLAADVGISPPAMLERVRRLEAAGVIERYVALVSPAAVGRDVIVMVSVSLAIHQLQSIDAFIEAVQGLEEVQECYHLTGEHDFLLKVVLPGIADYEAFVLTRLAKIPGVDRVLSSVVLSTVKRETRLPVGGE